MGLEQYYQCLLRRGETERVAWIPRRGARPGAGVELLPGREHWVVAAVYEHGMPEATLLEDQRLARTYVKRTDA